MVLIIQKTNFMHQTMYYNSHNSHHSHTVWHFYCAIVREYQTVGCHVKYYVVFNMIDTVTNHPKCDKNYNKSTKMRSDKRCMNYNTNSGAQSWFPVQ